MLDKTGREYVRAKMPMIGFGTFQVSTEQDIYATIDAAFSAGYRFIDSAQDPGYNNEHHIGKVLKELLPKHNLKREEIFITTKLMVENQGYEKAEKSILESLQKLQTDYVDLLLIHFPGCNRNDPNDPRNPVARRESWEVLEKLYKEKKLRSIGVSNYEISHLEELLGHATVLPAVNQCEYHPYYYTKDLVKYCESKDIHFQAYSSFGSECKKEALLSDPKIAALAKKYGTNVTNFLLAWALSQGISVLPRSRNPAHVKENLKALDIKVSPEDIEAARADNQTKFMWDPTKF